MLDLVDDTFIAAPPALVRAAVEDPALWRHWWPGLALELRRDRGLEGLRWNVRGDLVGTAELWIESVLDGVVLHWFLRVDPADGRTLRPRTLERLRRTHATTWKRHAWRLKDTLEAGRQPGSPARSVGERLP